MESPAETLAVPVSGVRAARAGNEALLLIALFKLLKSVLFFVAAFGVLKMIHKDTNVELTKLLHVFRIDGDRAFVKDMLVKTNVIDDPKKRIIGGLLALYAVLFGIEGTGLLLRQRWAEYFTVIMTSTGIPIELYEIFHRTAHKATTGVVNLVPEDQRPAFVFNHVFFLKVAALLLNVGIVWFLIHHLRRNAHHHASLAAAPAGLGEAGAAPP